MPFDDFGGKDHEQPTAWSFKEKTAWRRSQEEEGRPEVLLRQVGPNLFQLAEGFRYTTPPRAPKGAWNVPRHDVKADFGNNNSTDLASVPSWLWWFVASFGRHSRAALLHDHLIDLPDDVATDKAADRAFRDALGESEVPILRRWLMWDAVSLATMWRSKNSWWKLVVITFAVHLAGFAAALGYSIYRSWETLDSILAWPFVQLWSAASWVWSLGIVSGPIGWLWDTTDLVLVGSMDENPWWRTAVIGLAGLAAWRKRWLISVVGLLLIAVPTLAVFAARGVAYVLEIATWAVSKLRPPVKETEETEQAERARGLLEPPVPSFGDPFRQEGGPI